MSSSLDKNAVQRGSWQQLDQQLVYENPWISVTHENVLTPAGTAGIYGVVHFKSRAVGVVPLDDEGHVWLVKQFRYTLNQYSIEIPEGGSPLAEDMLETARRELREETGLTANEWTHLLDLHTSNSVTDENGVIYLARGLQRGETDFEATEDIEVLRVPLSEAIDWIFAGKITDSLSIMGLLATERHRNTGIL
ncbi:MAG: NUDIX hydrolase [Cellvibrionales bacterium]|jgi:8-oxo-dGTP pyrophosphatase MutT (NUDIX family)|nr:NUDIX hydrolase [Cellvibrionales bacterium]